MTMKNLRTLFMNYYKKVMYVNLLLKLSSKTEHTRFATEWTDTDL